MKWAEEFRAEILTEKRKVMGITKGMARHYNRMAGESIHHTCEDCDLSIGKYAGGYSRWCPNCGTDLHGQESHPRFKSDVEPTDEEPIIAEAYTLREKVRLFEHLNNLCKAAHVGYPMVEWSPNHRVVAPVLVENGRAIFSVHAPIEEARGRVIGSIDVPLGEIDHLAEQVELHITEYTKKLDSVTNLPRTLRESDSKCRHCRGNVGNQDKKCPNCGEKNRQFEEDGVDAKSGDFYTSLGTPSSNLGGSAMSSIAGGGIGEQGHEAGLDGHNSHGPMDYKDEGSDDLDQDEMAGDSSGPDGSGAMTQQMGTSLRAEATALLGEVFVKEIEELADGLPWSVDRPRNMPEANSSCKNCGKSASKGDMRGDNCRKCDSDINRPSNVPGKDYDEHVFDDRIGATMQTASDVDDEDQDVLTRLKRGTPQGVFNEAKFQITIQDGNNQNKVRAFEVTSNNLTSAIHRVQANKNHTVIAAIPLMEAEDGTPRDDAHLLGTFRYQSAVAIIFNESNEFLVGRASEVAGDDRVGKLVFPGGGIDPEDGGDPTAAASREAYEEMGVFCVPTGHVIDHPDHPGVAFCVCTYGNGTPTPNEEFTSYTWIPYAGRFAYKEEIYPANMAVLERIPPGIVRTAEDPVEEKYMDLPGFKRSDAKFLQQLHFRSDWAEANMERPDKRRAKRLSEAGHCGIETRNGSTFYLGLDEVGDQIYDAILEGSAIASKRITGGKGADPDPRAAPGTSMKAPEKQEPMTIPPAKTPTLTPPATNPDEEPGDLPEPAEQPGELEPEDDAEGEGGEKKTPPKDGKKPPAPKVPAAPTATTPPPGAAPAPQVPGAAPVPGAATPIPQPVVPGAIPPPIPPAAQVDPAQAASGAPVPAPAASPQQAVPGASPEPVGADVDPAADIEDKPDGEANGAPPEGALDPAAAAAGAMDPAAAAPAIDPATGQPAVDPTTGQPLPPGVQPGMVDPATGAPVQPGAPVGPMAPAPLTPGTTQTVDLALGNEEIAQQAYDWLLALGIGNLHMDGTTIRVSASSPAESDLIGRVAKAFTLELTGLSAPGNGIANQPEAPGGATPVQ